MSDMHSDSTRDVALERFARRVFADSVDSVDADTRARLAAARRRAVAAAAERRAEPRLSRLTPLPAWIAAGSAVALVVALVIAVRPGANPAGEDATRVARDLDRTLAAPDRASIEPIVPPDALASPVVLELLAGGEPDVLDALEEDLEFYAWLEQQPELAGGLQGP